MYCKKPAPVGYLYVTVDLPNYSGGHFFHYRYFVIHIVKVSGQSDWITNRTKIVTFYINYYRAGQTRTFSRLRIPDAKAF